MRVRLLIDVDVADEQLVPLSEALTKQPIALVQLPEPFGQHGGRCMGAHAVEVPKPAQVIR